MKTVIFMCDGSSPYKFSENNKLVFSLYIQTMCVLVNVSPNHSTIHTAVLSSKGVHAATVSLMCVCMCV